ncbi:MAG: hypothetical protein RLZZ436_1423 [Planctomycetota bacterium]
MCPAIAVPGNDSKNASDFLDQVAELAFELFGVVAERLQERHRREIVSPPVLAFAPGSPAGPVMC